MNVTFGYTVLYVADVDRALGFYTKAFGLRERFRHPSGSYAELDTGSTILALCEHDLACSAVPSPHTVRRTQPDGPAPGLDIAMIMDDVPTALASALGAGAEKVSDPVRKPWGQTVAIVRDLDGFLVELGTPTARDLADDEAADVVRRYLEVWNGGDLDILDEVISPEYVNHSAGMPDVPPGPAGLRPIIAGMRAGFPDLRYEVQSLVSDGCMVALRSVMTGTNTGSLFGQPPTGRAVNVMQMQFERVVDGVIMEHWRLTDDSAMTRQLTDPQAEV